jgi:CelD/BcsL family acetyltransferase involved in cellulose biosynthesis
MGWLSGQQMIKAVMLLGAPLMWATPCPAGQAFGIVPSTRGPQFTFYMAKPLGARVSNWVYGLRVDQASALPNLPTAAAIAAVRLRELVNLQFGPHTRTQIDFGRQVMWDLRGHQLGRRRIGHAADPWVAGRSLTT